MAAPTVSSVTPVSGPLGGTTSLALVGTGFTGTTAVAVGGTPATSFTVVDDTHLTVVAPAHAVGQVHIIVTNGTGAATPASGDQYTYVVAPAITGLSVHGGPAGGTNSVVITGTGFTTATGAAGVKFGATNATSYVVNSDTQITAVAPAHSAGSVQVLVTTPGGASPDTGADDYLYAAAPTVSSVTPDSGPADGGTSVAIVGTNFLGVSVVNFDAIPAASFVVVDSTHITAVAPVDNTAEAVDISVVAYGGTSSNTVADDYEFEGTYTQPDGTEDDTYFMDVKINPQTLADGSLFARLDTKRYPQVGVIADI